MFGWEKTLKEEKRCMQERQNPSFSSTLLDKIYRSIDESGTEAEDLRFLRDTTMAKKLGAAGNIKCSFKSNKITDDNLTLARGHSIDNKVANTEVKRRQSMQESERKQRRNSEYDQDARFFSSNSSSSDSSSGGFSSSDTESLHCVVKTRASCFAAPPRPKPVRTSVPAKSEKTERTLSQEQRKLQVFHDYRHNPSAEHVVLSDDSIIKSKSRALKLYNNLKKVKQPISPGGRLASFINSLFTASANPKKTKSSASSRGCYESNTESNEKSGHDSTCSSASSFSRSCLSKHSPATRERLRNGVKRTVRFYPVSVIVDEDCKPCGHKSLCEEDGEPDGPNSTSISVPSARKTEGRPPISRKIEETEDFKCQVVEKGSRVEEAAREFLRDYYQNQRNKRNDHFSIRGSRQSFQASEVETYEDDEDDDAASCSSSDLFELDHLAVMGKDRYHEELPVYETTHVVTNRAIANGLIM